MDPKTGNLAVTNYLSVGGSERGYGDVAIFKNAQGTPSTYFDPQLTSYNYCAYDDKGNLYVDGHDGPTGTIAELPKNSASFLNITLTKDVGPISMQWLGSSLVVSSIIPRGVGPQPIYEVQVSGSSGIVSGPVLLRSLRKLGPRLQVQFLVHRRTIIGPDQRHRGNDTLVNFWHYPAGGWPKKIVRHIDAESLYGVTMSNVTSVEKHHIRARSVASEGRDSR
ncbi:MAG: hypothetical protein WA431_15795 [Candidatus Cybelea sp.]